jgi:hypothetical protein
MRSDPVFETGMIPVPTVCEHKMSIIRFACGVLRTSSRDRARSGRMEVAISVLADPDVARHEFARRPWLAPS